MNARRRRLAKQRRLTQRRAAEEYWRWRNLVYESFDPLTFWSS